MTDAPPTSPADGSSTAPSTGDAVVIRRDPRRILRLSSALLVACVLLVIWLPAIIVVVRREPAYFTNGVLLTALIGTGAVLLVGLAVVAWRAFARPKLLTVTAAGVEIPAARRREARSFAWEQLELVRLVGDADPALVFHVRPEEPEDSEEKDDLDLSEPEFLRPLDFAADPPPPTVPPGEDAFARIRPVPEDDEEPPPPEPVPHAALHGTPHVVSLTRPNPPLPDVLGAITRLSAGRVRLD